MLWLHWKEMLAIACVGLSRICGTFSEGMKTKPLLSGWSDLAHGCPIRPLWSNSRFS